MSELSLLERIISAYNETGFVAKDGIAYIQLDAAVGAACDHQYDLVARIKAIPETTPTKGDSHWSYRYAIADVLALIKPAVKESSTTQSENRDTTTVACGASDATPREDGWTYCPFCDVKASDAGAILHHIANEHAPRDHRPARDALFVEQGDAPSDYGVAYNSVEGIGFRAIVEAIDSAADRIARALEGRKRAVVSRVSRPEKVAMFNVRQASGVVEGEG